MLVIGLVFGLGGGENRAMPSACSDMHTIVFRKKALSGSFAGRNNRSYVSVFGYLRCEEYGA